MLPINILKNNPAQDRFYLALSGDGMLPVAGTFFIMDATKHKNIVGTTYGYLTVVRELDRAKTNYGAKRVAECRCVCGKIVVRWLVQLCVQKHKHHCGCKNKTHNVSHTPIHRMWCNMKKRCYRINASGYYRYGGRGISVCEEWKNDFMAFYEWAKANGYKEGLEIDRINTDGDYEPSNCRFVTRIENMNNRKYGIRVILDGSEMSITDACRKLGLMKDVNKIRQRMGSYKWSFEEAIKV